MKYFTNTCKTIILVLLIAFKVSPLFGQHENNWESIISENKNKIINSLSINAQVSYFPSFIQTDFMVTTTPVYPYGFHQAAGYAVQLGIGLKLFNKINTVFDFALDDPHMTTAMKIAGLLETEYFDIIYTYKSTFFPEKRIDTRTTLPSSEYDKWYFPQEGEKLKAKLDVGTLALMSPRFWNVYKIGFIWNSVDANLCLQSNKMIDGRYVAFMDVDRHFNTYGIRLAMNLPTHGLILYSGTIGTVKAISNTYLDLSWGKVNLSDEAITAIGIKNNESDISNLTIRANFGLIVEKEYPTKSIFSYGLGIDFYYIGVTNNINDPATFGIFALVGLTI